MPNAKPILPADIPSDARTVITWHDAPALIDAILANCPELRRLYLLDTQPRADDTQYSANNKCGRPTTDSPFIRILRADPTLPPAPQIQPVWEAEPLFFAEGRTALHLPDDFRRQLPQFADELETFCLEFLRGFFANMAFRTVRGWHMLENIFLNIPALPRAKSIKELDDCACGRPVIVIGAGPALDQNIEWLRRMQSHALLIACDSAWLPLDRADIVPDLVVSTDAGDIVWRFWAALSERQRHVPLVALPQSGWPAVHYHPGALYVCRSLWPGYNVIERELGRQLDALDTGQCVGHAAFELACRMGADSIILAGFNLAYQDNHFHPRHMAAPVFHEKPPPPENLLTVPGIDGRPVTTDLSMYMYLREFERRFAGFTAKTGKIVWDATGAGARKQGVKIMDHTTIANAGMVQKRRLTDHKNDRLDADSPSILKLKAQNSNFKWRANAMSRSLPVFEPYANTNGIQPQQCAAALSRWHDDAVKLIGRIDAFCGNARQDQKTFMSPAYPDDNASPQLLEIMAGALNQRLAAELHFAREDLARTGQMPGRLPDIAEKYFQDMRHIANVMAEATAHATRTQAPDATRIIALLPAGGTPPDWDKIQKHLAADHLKVTVYQGELEDIPQVWRQFRMHNAAIALTVEDTAMPAAWHLPGQICLNLRWHPPIETTAFNHAENWMPGYAVIAMTTRAAQTWRKRLPPDRPLHLWQAPNRLLLESNATPCRWPAIIAQLQNS